MWGVSEHLLAAVVDELSVANWQRSQGKQRDFPKPLPRPGKQEPQSNKKRESSLTPEQKLAALRARAPKRPEGEDSSWHPLAKSP